MKRADIVSGFVLLALAGLTIREAWLMPPATGYSPGAGFLPFWVGVIIAGLATLLLATAWLRQAAPAEAPLFPGKGALIRVTLVLVGLALYIVLLEPAGFVPGTLLFVAFLMAAVQRETVRLTATVSILTTGGLYLIFRVLLGITLPRGPLGF